MKQPKRKKLLDPNTVQLIRQIMGGVLVVILVVILIVSVRYGTRLQAMTIDSVTVTGGETINHDLIEQLVESQLEGEYWRLIPKRFTYLYPKQDILNALETINRIKNPKVKRESRTALLVTVDEYVPEALWCNDAGEDCVFIDDTGYAFANAPSLTGGSFLRLDKLGVEPVTDVQAFSTTEYNQIKAVITLLETEGWFVSAAEADVAGDAYLTLTEGGELKIALSDAPEQIVENLFTVLASPEFSTIEPGNFEYIDLRFGNKVFVNELGPETELELATSTETE